MDAPPTPLALKTRPRLALLPLAALLATLPAAAQDADRPKAAPQRNALQLRVGPEKSVRGQPPLNQANARQLTATLYRVWLDEDPEPWLGQAKDGTLSEEHAHQFFSEARSRGARTQLAPPIYQYVVLPSDAVTLMNEWETSRDYLQFTKGPDGRYQPNLRLLFYKTTNPQEVHTFLLYAEAYQSGLAYGSSGRKLNENTVQFLKIELPNPAADDPNPPQGKFLVLLLSVRLDPPPADAGAEANPPPTGQDPSDGP